MSSRRLVTFGAALVIGGCTVASGDPWERAAATVGFFNMEPLTSAKAPPEGGSESEKVHGDAQGNHAGRGNGEEEFWTGQHRPSGYRLAAERAVNSLQPRRRPQGREIRRLGGFDGQ